MEIKLLHLLSEKDLSITELNAKLNQPSHMTLSQIGKINTSQGNLIITRNSKYGLARSLSWLNETKISDLLKQSRLTYTIHVLDQVNSTNSYALNNIENFRDKTIITTDWQNSGRGRFGRTWISQVAHDLTVSFIYIFEPGFNISLLPTICAVAVNRLLKNHSISNSIKWPNDIYVNADKVAGILVENLVRGKEFKTVIGIGLNNIGHWERNKLLCELISSVDNIINEFQLFGFSLLRREWLDNCLHLGKKVIINKDGCEIDRGIHKDISEKGELIIKTAIGDKSYSNSEISLLFDSKLSNCEK